MAPRRTLWIITPSSFSGLTYRLDEVVSPVASTKPGALRYLKTTIVDPGTGWGIQPFALETFPGEQGRQVLYARTGRVMKKRKKRGRTSG